MGEVQQRTAAPRSPARPRPIADTRPKRRLLERLRRRPDDDDYDDYEPFVLPEPDASFATPWVRPLAPAAVPQPLEPPLLLQALAPPRPRPAGSPRPRPTPTASSRPRPRPRPAGSAAAAPAGTPPAPSAPPAAQRPLPDIPYRESLDESPSRNPKTVRGRHAKAPAGRSLLRVAIVVLIAGLAALLLRAYVVEPYYIPSASMEPTLHGCPGCNDDRILVDKLSYRSHAPNPGDIIVFDRPPGDTAPENVLVKRVVAGDGDTVSLRNGLVYVNGLRIPEPYINKQCGPQPSQPLTGRSTWVVPKGRVFVMGDNRCNSHDSRAFGPIADSAVVGRAFAIYWPLSRVGTL